MKHLKQLLDELNSIGFFNKNQLCIIGCSTSEVRGSKIGSDGSIEIAKELFDSLELIHKETGVRFAFQGCEHINRAITIEREVFDAYSMAEVSVIPQVNAGGSLSTYAYQHMKDPVVVEHIQCDKGIDIGQTLIGMHLKHVAVPISIDTKNIGEAIVTVAKSRPKLIGGARAKY
ncbi:TIGR01440 family protein [Mammaliicoccus fleurettii]|uniref:TIGR01440 family protein n=1 Tax=Mammaliicoccus fleurettii TaxID=150056 RepID=UPI001AADCD7D|nr:TIGR01440 family protein [Mammaliicoccus fleurettii]